jgi:hypothetical protein
MVEESIPHIIILMVEESIPHIIILMVEESIPHIIILMVEESIPHIIIFGCAPISRFFKNRIPIRVNPIISKSR